MYTLYLQRKRRKVIVLRVAPDKLWRLLKIKNVVYRPQNFNNVDVLFPIVEEWLVFLKPSVFLNAKGKETLASQKCFCDSLQPDRICPSSKAYEH